MRFLINKDGNPFDGKELGILYDELKTLDNTGRSNYRNENASAIANYQSVKFLIVSGPGTGKSTLFLSKINYWFKQDPLAKILVTTFVRKLSIDLQKDIDNLPEAQENNITVSTLHKIAKIIVGKSIAYKSNETAKQKLTFNFQIITGKFWENFVWQDVLSFFSDKDKDDFNWDIFKKQLHDDLFENSKDWQELREKYFDLCVFYNAATFADIILLAKDTLIENNKINDKNYFIIDEYQDFNNAENNFINQLICETKGVLVVGDDEQILYDNLKSGNSDLIKGLYCDSSYTNGMLPFCGRSSFHIVATAEQFIKSFRTADCIEKIYLPITTSDGKPKVQVICCTSPQTAVDYVEKFVEDNKVMIEERKNKLISGEKKDPFLLILSPSKDMSFYGESKEKIMKIIENYRVENHSFSIDYYRVLDYYSLTKDHTNNFIFRKIIYYEEKTELEANKLINIAMSGNLDFFEIDSEIIKLAVKKSENIKEIIDNNVMSIDEKIEKISQCISIDDKSQLKEDLICKPIGLEQIVEIEKEKEESAEMDEIGVAKMGAVELMTILGSKGLSADHVIIIGFDDVNMRHVTKNAFYVAMTRARDSLHLITALKCFGSMGPHVFLERLPGDHLEFYKYKKSDRTTEKLDNMVKFKSWLDFMYNMTSQNSKANNTKV